jgi:hypothetical protein
MNTIAIKDVEYLDDGIPVPSITGTVVSVFKRSKGEGEYGPWSFQDFKLTDHTGGVATVKACNFDDLSEYRGKTIELRCHKSEKHGWTGLKKLVEEHNGKTYHKIKMTESAKITVNGENGQDDAPSPGAKPASPPLPYQGEETAEPDVVTLARRALMQVANAQYLVKRAVSAEVGQSDIGNIYTTPENFGGQCGSAFKYLNDLGLVARMPTVPIWPTASSTNAERADRQDNKKSNRSADIRDKGVHGGVDELEEAGGTKGNW